MVPLEKTFYFLNNLIGPIFEKDSEILKIYLERFDLIFKYFIRVLFQFFTEFNNFIAPPGGSVYYELSTAISSFNYFNYVDRYRIISKAFKKYLTPTQISNLLLPFGKFVDEHYSKIKSIKVHWYSLFSQFINWIYCKFSGHLKADFVPSRVDQIVKVLLTSNVLPAYKSTISSSLQEYCKIQESALSIPSDPIKNLPPCEFESQSTWSSDCKKLKLIWQNGWWTYK